MCFLPPVLLHYLSTPVLLFYFSLPLTHTYIHTYIHTIQYNTFPSLREDNTYYNHGLCQNRLPDRYRIIFKKKRKKKERHKLPWFSPALYQSPGTVTTCTDPTDLTPSLLLRISRDWTPKFPNEYCTYCIYSEYMVSCLYVTRGIIIIKSYHTYIVIFNTTSIISDPSSWIITRLPQSNPPFRRLTSGTPSCTYKYIRSF